MKMGKRKKRLFNELFLPKHLHWEGECESSSMGHVPQDVIKNCGFMKLPGSSGSSTASSAP